MHKFRKNAAIFLSLIAGIPIASVTILLAVGGYLYFTADFLQPDISIDLSRHKMSLNTDSSKVCGNATLRLNRHGLWETHITGSPAERGAAYGVVNKELLKYQEDVFVEQIHEIIPSEWWVEFLHKVIIIFNRGMAKHIPAEYREEIYAMSLSATNDYNSYGSPYVRQLNYHAAHDIGHAMQEYMLVGCTSFACWGGDSEANDLIIGRNFDFYVGDNFAKNKVVLFVEPSEGYRFASISWPGMMGVLSGMNEKGLTVTINAAKGAIPTSSAMPISLLARHILQYAANIDEAYDIANRFRTFVSESLLIGSSNDGYAAIIEKTPEKIALYKSSDTRILCTNHYQSDTFKNDEYNCENIKTSDSPYRYNRLDELIEEHSPLNAEDAVTILRNRHGTGHADIGIGNEKSINQFIAHHSIVFQPEKLRFWVSTQPWQLGEYICYDLNNVFDGSVNACSSYAIDSLNIEAEDAMLDYEYVNVCLYRDLYKELGNAIDKEQEVSTSFVNKFISSNPNHFQVYNRLGDYELSRNNYSKAIEYWKKALLLEIPRTTEKDEIIQKIKKYDQEY